MEKKTNLFYFECKFYDTKLFKWQTRCYPKRFRELKKEHIKEFLIWYRSLPGVTRLTVNVLDKDLNLIQGGFSL